MRAFMVIMALVSAGGIFNAWVMPTPTIGHLLTSYVLSGLSFVALVICLAAIGIMGTLREIELFQQHMASLMDREAREKWGNTPLGGGKS